MKTFLFAIALALFAHSTLFAQGTDPGIAAKHAIGEVKTID
jgi:hypothetical protein